MQPFSENSKIFLKNHLSQKLSRREVEVVVLVLEGLTNREVANQLCVAEKTVKFHLTNIYKKLNISRRSQIIWTLPLSDFVEARRNSSTVNSPAKENAISARSGTYDGVAEVIPAGCITVAEQEESN